MTDFCCIKARENLLPTKQHHEQENMQSVCSDYVVRVVGDFFKQEEGTTAPQRSLRHYTSKSLALFN